jgi:hypothetical protein
VRLHPGYVVLGFVLVAPFAGCRDNPVTQTLEAAASAKALASAMVQEAQTSITGKMHSVGGELGTWDVALNECHSGESEGFYGVDFYVKGSDELRLRYVHDEAKGDVVKIGIPSKKDTALVLDRSDGCTVLDGALEKTNFTTWTPKGKIRHLSGHVKFDCKHSAGKGHVTGEVTFSHCH